MTSEFAPFLATPGMVTAALWSDVDRDGRPDLLVEIEGIAFSRKSDATLPAMAISTDCNKRLELAPV